jgi:hypothetical protein
MDCVVTALRKEHLFIVVFLNCSIIGGYTQGQTQAIVDVVPSAKIIEPSFTDTLFVRVDDVENLFAASVTLAFDSTILHYCNVTAGSFLTRNNTISVFLGVVPQPPAPAATNKITIDQAIPGGGTVSGSGVLFTIEFTALRSGSSPVTIVSVDLRNGLNMLIPTKTVSGLVTVNSSPVITSSPTLTAFYNQLYQYQLKGYDPDGDSISYNFINAPVFLSIDSSTGLISGIPAREFIGQYTVIVQIKDSKGVSNQQIYTLKVIRINNAPAAVQLLSPSDGITIDTALTVILMWSKAVDFDSGDVVRYIVHLTSAISDMSFNNLSATTITLTKDVLNENNEYTWYVDATDGIDTTSSTYAFKFKTPMITGCERCYFGIPDVIKIEQNYPNPFNSSTMIRFSVSNITQVAITIYDLLGREIAKLLNARLNSGYHTVTWDGKNNKGIMVGSGTYIYVMSAGENQEAKKMILLK